MEIIRWILSTSKRYTLLVCSVIYIVMLFSTVSLSLIVSAAILKIEKRHSLQRYILLACTIVSVILLFIIRLLKAKMWHFEQRARSTLTDQLWGRLPFFEKYVLLKNVSSASNLSSVCMDTNKRYLLVCTVVPLIIVWLVQTLKAVGRYFLFVYMFMPVMLITFASLLKAKIQHCQQRAWITMSERLLCRLIYHKNFKKRLIFPIIFFFTGTVAHMKATNMRYMVLVCSVTLVLFPFLLETRHNHQRHVLLICTIWPVILTVLARILKAEKSIASCSKPGSPST